ncbi:MAG TPA: HD domain-containing protein [Acidimicrobiales bacterium]|nr:HD domain-containing protein [Acidimicrobiales bacterium]
MVRAARLSRLRHLARRFAGSLSRRGPAAEDEAWALGLLVEGERALWHRMSGADRRHAVAVARRLGDRPREVLAAGLLHDVGKIESGLGTVARVGATVAGAAGGRARWRGRLGAYLRHDEIGAGLLTAAGSHPLTVAWAREHHLPPERWTVPRVVGDALKTADDD